MKHPMHELWMSIAIVVTSLVGCDPLDDVPRSTCGNLVVEAAEQCDGEATCGTDGPAACRFTCDAAEGTCPGALACSAEGICVASAGRFVPYELAPRYEFPVDELVVGDVDGDLRDDVIGVGRSIRVRFGAPEAPLLASYEKQIRPPTGAASIAQLDGEGGLDIVFPTAEGVFTLVSRGRSFDAIPYASVGVLPDDSSPSCLPFLDWIACQSVDVDRDGRVDKVGFRFDHDNVEIELARPSGPAVKVVVDTLDVVTDLSAADFDGDGFADVAFSTRPVNGAGTANVFVTYGAPQPESFTTQKLLETAAVTGIAARDIDTPPDGIADLAVEQGASATRPVSVYLGNPARDLSAPFRLDGGRTDVDVPFALVAGEFVGGPDSGVDVMAYAENPETPGVAYFWWLRGTGGANLTLGALDPVDGQSLEFLRGKWKVRDLVDDVASGNGPDEVIGLSPAATGCIGPALTVAVPSARFTPTELIRTACLGVEGGGWEASTIEVVGRGDNVRAVGIARRADQFWIGQAPRLDQATQAKELAGVATAIDPMCRDPQIWPRTQSGATAVSWACDTAQGVDVRSSVFDGTTIDTASSVEGARSGSDHVVGDFNGDGLVDILVRRDRELAVVLQCSTDMVGTTPGC